MIHLLGLLGVLSISFSPVFIRLADVSPVTAVFFRALYALPLLVGLWWWRRGGDRREPSARWLAVASGVVLAADLACWHQSIALVGAGLGTVIANVQVVFIAIIGWFLYGERPTGRTVVVLTAVLLGIALTSGLARQDAYGEAPVLGVLFGIAAGGCYAGYLLMFRAASRSPAPRVSPLLDSTLGMAAGALVVSIVDAGFSFQPAWPAHGWLIALALVGQVIGWLLIASALTTLPALETSILLLVQPVFAIVWGRVIFGERMSVLQWAGTLLVLGGVGVLSSGRTIHERPAAATRQDPRAVIVPPPASPR